MCNLIGFVNNGELFNTFFYKWVSNFNFGKYFKGNG